ncbi:hypothetical protein PSACC_03163, partial [Paramicrosporidium saccamoebae]
MRESKPFIATKSAPGSGVVVGPVSQQLVSRLFSMNLFPLLTFLSVVHGEYADVEKDQNAFLENFDLSGKLFSPKNWYLHTADFFRKMKSRHARKFMEHFIESAADSDHSPNWKDASVAKTFFSNIRREDVELIRKKGVCLFLGLGINLNPVSFSHARHRCSQELVGLAKERKHVLEALPVEIFKTHPQLAMEMGEELFGMSAKATRAALDDPNICKYIDASLINEIADGPTRRLVTARCFTKLKNIQRTDMENLSSFRDDILTKLSSPLTAPTVSNITREQIRRLEASPNVCLKLKIEHLSSTAASGLGEKCLHNYLKSSDEGRPTSLNDLWRHFSSTILGMTLKSDPKLIRGIHSNDYKHIGGTLLGNIFQVSEACSYISRGAKLQLSSTVKINKSCFSKLSTTLQPMVIAGIKSPPADILAMVNDQMMSNWRLETKGKVLRGFQVLSVLGKDSVVLIKNLSTESSDHACSSIPNAATLLLERWFVDHMTEECVKSLQFTIRYAEGKKNIRVWVLQNMDNIVRGTVEHQSDIVPLITFDILKLLVSKESFCKNMSPTFFKLLSLGAKGSISRDCFLELKVKKVITSTDISAMPADVLTKLCASTFGELKWESIPDSHLESVSKETSSGKRHAFSLLKKSIISTWDPKRVALITIKQWPQIPSDAFRGLRALQIEAIPNNSLKYWDYEQVACLTREAALSLSPLQIEALGAVVDRTAAQALKPYLAEMKPSQRDLVSLRISTSPFGWKTLLLFAAAGLSCCVVESSLGSLLMINRLRRGVTAEVVYLWTGDSIVGRYLIVRASSILSTLCSVLLILLVLNVLRRGKRCIRCEMSIMAPGYTDYSSQVVSEYSYKYRLFKYNEFGRNEQPGCFPVLFIPGCSGSYRQVRSFASATIASPGVDCYDFFAVDFRQEFVAFLPGLLEQQSVYVNDALQFLLAEYPSKKSIGLVGHSFGGIIARLLPNLKNYALQQHQAFLVTIASPHKRAPLVTTRRMDTLYTEISNHRFDRSISVLPSSSDILVPVEISPLPEVFKEVRVDQLSPNWSDPNHQAMVWERGLLKRLAKLFRLALGSDDSSYGRMLDEDSVQVDSTLSNAVQCETILYKDNFTHGDVCGLEKKTACIITKAQGAFSIITNEQFPEQFSIHIGSHISEQSGKIQIKDPRSTALVIQKYPGRTYSLDTTTNARTQLTETITRISGNHAGDLLVVLKCDSDNRFGMSPEVWDIQIQDESFEDLQSSRSTTILSLSKDTYHETLRLDTLLWPQSFQTNGQTAISLRGHWTLPVVLNIHADESVLVRAVDKKGRAHFPTLSSGEDKSITIYPDTMIVELVSSNGEVRDARLRINLLETLTSIVISHPQELLLSLFLISTSLRSLSAWGTALMMICRFWIIHQSSLMELALYAVLLFSITAFIAAANRTSEWWTLRPSLRQASIAMFIMLLLPITDSLRNGLLAVFYISLCEMPLTAVLANIGSILVVSAQVRNILVLSQEIGVSQVVKNELRPGWSIERAIPPSWMIEDGYDLVNTLTRLSPYALEALQLDTLKPLAKNSGRACELLTASWVMGLRRRLLGEITSDCFAALKNVNEANFPATTLSFLPKDVLSQYAAKLTATTLLNLSPHQLEMMGSQVHGPICQGFDTTVLPDIWDFVSARCLKEYLTRGDCSIGRSPLQWKQAHIDEWREFLPDLLPDLIVSRHYINLPRELKLKFITNEVFPILQRLKKCSILQGLEMTSREFCLLGSDSIRWLRYAGITLPDDFLSRCDSVGNIFRSQKEWYILANNNPNVIRKMTSETEAHFCATLSEEAYSKNLVLRRFGGSSCRQALQFKRTERVQIRLPELKKHHHTKDSKWWGRKGGILGMLLVGRNGWKPSPRSIRHMSNVSLALIDGTIALYYRKYISSENAKKLAWNAFKRFTVDDFAGLQFSHLSSRQIPYLSAELFSTITATHLSALNSKQLRAITSDQW